MKGPALRKARFFLAGGLAFVLALSACGDSEPTGASRKEGRVGGRLSVIHEDGGGTFPDEGALTVVTVRALGSEKALYEGMVSYPGLSDEVGPDGPAPRRYLLLRDVELPVGPVFLSFDVRPCSMVCPNLRTAKLDDINLDRPDGVSCELDLEVTWGEPREVVVVWEALELEPAPCHLAN